MTTIVLSSGTLVPSLSEPNYLNGGMSFLQMVQRLRQESGTSGNGPVTVAAQTGDYKRLVDWISTAWMDIQNERRDWFFMRQAISFNTVAGQRAYTAEQAGVASFGNFKRDSFRQYRVSIGFGSECDIYFLPYDQFRNMYMRNSTRTLTGQPLNFTIDPSKNFLLGPIPDAIFNINGEGYAMPTEFALDADRSTMPSQYHMAIVWKALQYYGTYEAASESFDRGKTAYDAIMSPLYVDQLPEFCLGEPLL